MYRTYIMIWVTMGLNLSLSVLRTAPLIILE